jgi:hypothetical protein
MACTVDAPVVQTSSTITTFAPFFRNPSMRCPVPCCFSAWRTRNPLNSPLMTETATTIGSAPMVRPPMRFPSALPDLVREHLASELRSARIERGGATVNVVIAGRTRRQLELAQFERLVGEQAQQFLAGRGHMNF